MKNHTIVRAIYICRAMLIMLSVISVPMTLDFILCAGNYLQVLPILYAIKYSIVLIDLLFILEATKRIERA